MRKWRKSTWDYPTKPVNRRSVSLHGRRSYLEAGESREVTLHVDVNDSCHPLSYWDVDSGSWKLAPGSYNMYLGNSSHNLSLAGQAIVAGGPSQEPALLPRFYAVGRTAATAQDFKKYCATLGR